MCILLNTIILQEILLSAGRSDWQFNIQTAKKLYTINIYINLNCLFFIYHCLTEIFILVLKKEREISLS